LGHIDVFTWTLVMIHRKIALGTKVPDDKIGSYIQQYGSHFLKCGTPHKPQPFHFDPTKSYSGRNITYHELTAWIMGPRFAPNSHGYAKRWDAAIKRTDTTWTEFKTKMEVARKPYW
jgi:hypothetical protein